MVHAPRDSVDAGTCEIITPPHALKLKAGNGNPILSEAIIRRAEIVLSRLHTDHPDWFSQDIACLQNIWPDVEARADGAVARLYRAAHDLRSQAAGYGYSSVARLAQSLCRLIEAQSPEQLPIRLAQTHVEAISAAYREKRQTPDDPITATVLETLEGKVRLARAITASRKSSA